MNLKTFLLRWKAGILAITPLQQAKISLVGSFFILGGILIGLYTTFVLHTWWLFVILLGSLVVSAVSTLGILQKYHAYKTLEDVMKGGQNEQNSAG